MSRFIALCAHGLEEFVVSELGDVSGVQIFDGVVLFDFKGKIEVLLDVKVVDEILLLVKRLAGSSVFLASHK